MAEGLLHIMNDNLMIAGASEATVPLYIRGFKMWVDSMLC